MTPRVLSTRSHSYAAFAQDSASLAQKRTPCREISAEVRAVPPTTLPAEMISPASSSTRSETICDRKTGSSDSLAIFLSPESPPKNAGGIELQRESLAPMPAVKELFAYFQSRERPQLFPPEVHRGAA